MYLDTTRHDCFWMIELIDFFYHENIFLIVYDVFTGIKLFIFSIKFLSSLICHIGIYLLYFIRNIKWNCRNYLLHKKICNCIWFIGICWVRLSTYFLVAKQLYEPLMSVCLYVCNIPFFLVITNLIPRYLKEFYKCYKAVSCVSKGRSNGIPSLGWSLTNPRMVTHQPKDGPPPEGSVL